MTTTTGDSSTAPSRTRSGSSRGASKPSTGSVRSATLRPTFLESVATGVQGEPGFRVTLVVARVQEAFMRSWASERWEPVACKE